MSPALFTLVTFKIGSHTYAQLAWTTVFLFRLPTVAAMLVAHHGVQSLVEMGSHNLLALAGLNLKSSSSLPLK
jgi:hypothetical protein